MRNVSGMALPGSSIGRVVVAIILLCRNLIFSAGSFDVAKSLLKVIDPIGEDAQRFTGRIGQRFLPLRAARVWISPGDCARRHADGSGVRWHVFQHDRPSANASAVADGDRAEHLGPNTDDDVVAERWMALAALLAGAAERDALVEGDVITDDCGFADYDAHAVVDEKAAPDRGAGMNFDPGQEAGKMRKHPRKRGMTAAPEPVGEAVGKYRVKTRVGEQNLDRSPCCRVALLDCGDVFSYLGECHLGFSCSRRS